MNAAALHLYHHLFKKFGNCFLHIVEDGYFFSVTQGVDQEAHTFPFTMQESDVPAFVKVFKLGREEEQPKPEPKQEEKPKAKKRARKSK